LRTRGCGEGAEQQHGENGKFPHIASICWVSAKL
jgi:hypothetical protein